MILKLGSLASVVLLVVLTIGSASEISVRGGTSVGVSEGSSVEGGLASDGLVTHSSASSTGVIKDLNIDPWVQDRYGDYVEIGVKGTNVAGFSYSDKYYPGKDSGWESDDVSAQQWLGASSADYLYAYSYAINAGGAMAKADMTIKYGSLDGYYNSAYAGSAPSLGVKRGAFVEQTVRSATGNNILAQTYAVDAPGDSAGSRTEVKSGSLTGYSALAEGVRFSDVTSDAGVSVDWVSASAPLGSINQLTLSQNYNGDRVADDMAKANVTINHGSLDGYHSSAYAGSALQPGIDRGAFGLQTVGSATGNNILGQTLTNDSPGDLAGSMTEVKSGSLTGYSAIAESVKYSDGMRGAGVSVDQVSASAPVGSIDQLTWSQNYNGDRVEVGTAINKGNLYSYPSNSNYPSLAYSIGDLDWTGAVQSVDASSSGLDNYFTSYGKFYDPSFGSKTYNQAYTNGRHSFWNSAVTRPTFAGQWHGILS